MGSDLNQGLTFVPTSKPMELDKMCYQKHTPSILETVSPLDQKYGNRPPSSCPLARSSITHILDQMETPIPRIPGYGEAAFLGTSMLPHPKPQISISPLMLPVGYNTLGKLNRKGWVGAGRVLSTLTVGHVRGKKGPVTPSSGCSYTESFIVRRQVVWN